MIARHAVRGLECTCACHKTPGLELCAQCQRGCVLVKVKKNEPGQQLREYGQEVSAVRSLVRNCGDCTYQMVYLESAKFGPHKGNPVWWCPRCRYTIPA